MQAKADFSLPCERRKKEKIISSEKSKEWKMDSQKAQAIYQSEDWYDFDLRCNRIHVQAS